MEIYKNLSIESLPNEEWRDIVGYEGLYQVSNLGRVKSLSKFRNAKHPYISKEKILVPRWSGEKGHLYPTVLLCNNYHSKNFRVHRLVALHFCPNPNNYVEVNHKDENRANNNANNLEWCSRSYNVNYGQRNAKAARKIQKKVLAFSKDGVFIREFDSLKDAGIFAKVDASNITKACQKKRLCGGYKWQYKK